jgi:hypothetical protein
MVPCLFIPIGGVTVRFSVALWTQAVPWGVHPIGSRSHKDDTNVTRQGIKTQAPVTVPAYWKGKENTTMTEIETLKAQLEAANGKLKDLETRIQNLTLFHRHELRACFQNTGRPISARMLVYSR